MAKGMDVSKHQGVIDWEKVKADGVEFAMLRAGYGRFDAQKDEYFEQNYAAATAAGVPVGAYHYSYAKSVEDAATEAKTFLKWIAGKRFAYPVALDIEEEFQAQKGAAFVSDIIRAFCSTVEAAGYYVCIYANKHWLETYVDADCKTKYDVWVAQWAAENTYSGAYGMWQATSSGKVNGVQGRVDLNVAYKDYPAIMSAKGLNGYAKKTPPAKPSKEFPPKTVLALYNTPLYVSSTAKTPSAHKSGTFYIYDGKELNGRYRITSSAERAGKTPMADNVTGYVNKSDLR